MVFVDPARFCRPPTDNADSRSRVSVFLDGQKNVDWNEITAIVARAYRTVAPNDLIAKLDGS